MKAYFRERYPVMLDGAPIARAGRGSLLRQARESLAAGTFDPARIPGPFLREALEQVAAAPAGSTQAGLIPVGPNSARVWWDKGVLDSLGDVFAHLDRPKAVLRFFDITGLNPEAGRWHESFDVDIEMEECGRTVPLWSSDRTYVVDLGYVHADGRFLRLARTNAVRLPRDKAGPAGDGVTAQSVLRRRASLAAGIVPDEDARDWVAARGDFPERDVETELIVHMLYRAFLREGPRALRRSPGLIRRNDAALRREFAQRQRPRRRTPTAAPASPALLLARLDSGRLETGAPELRHRPVHVAVRPSVLLDAAPFAWLYSALSAARNGIVAAAERPPERAEPAALVRRMEPIAPSVSLSLMANPVFEAARNLRKGLSDLESVASESIELEEDVVAAFGAGSAERFGDRDADASPFGGVEAKRMARAGVRITRMALTLEGRMRPGARLKVAGRLVHADANGRFRLECVLTGKRASIPVRAGTSIEGEARSLINVDWERRAASDKRKVYGSL